MIVTISGIDFLVYRDLETADSWFTGSLQADVWFSFEDDQRRRMLVETTRLLDAQCWKGSPCNPSEALTFPREGLTDCCGGGALEGCTEMPDGLFYGVLGVYMTTLAAFADLCGEFDSSAPPIPAPTLNSLPEAVHDRWACWLESASGDPGCCAHNGHHNKGRCC